MSCIALCSWYLNVCFFSLFPFQCSLQFCNITEASNQNSKSATIEMYAPSSYNDTVTGETLSSVSEKSDSYSNEGSQPDYMVSILSFILCFIDFTTEKWYDRSNRQIEKKTSKPKPIIWAIRGVGKNYSMNSI